MPIGLLHCKAESGKIILPKNLARMAMVSVYCAALCLLIHMCILTGL